VLKPSVSITPNFIRPSAVPSDGRKHPIEDEDDDEDENDYGSANKAAEPLLDSGF
jgi:hypothetical protein